MKRKLHRLLALILCVLMISSDFSGFITPAQAAPAAQAATAGNDKEFRDEVNGRPNLFVDFLGDNNRYPYTAQDTHSGKNGVNGALVKQDATSLNTIAAPAPYDQSNYINPYPGNKWDLYVPDDCNPQNVRDTVFWVGVGVDRLQLWKLLESDEGLTSLEAGFYYDSSLIEPYVDMTLDADPDEAYKKTIEKANINNSNYPANTQWNSSYTILRAERGLEPETDAVTAEELTTPTMDDILHNRLSTTYGGQSNWKMTYVSLELSDIDTPAVNRRFGGKGIYQGVQQDGDGNPITPAAASGNQYIDDDPTQDYDYNYLLLIPFRLKAYGSTDWTPLRLVRDATHFSIGASRWGVDAYGAWERSTVRNPQVNAVAAGADTLSVEGHPARDLKLLTRFAGDLNLFGRGRVQELEYNALLKIISGGGSLNSAKLTVDGDPAVWPVWADSDGQTIGGLQSGLGMRLDVHTQEGYEAIVTVTYEQATANGAETVYHQYTQILDDPYDDAYTFVMPEFVPAGARTVTVTVKFQYKSGDEFRIYLSEDPQPGDAGHMVGNETTIRTNLDNLYVDTTDTNRINSYDAKVDHPNSSHGGITHPDATPVGFANRDKKVEISVAAHADYEAVVRVYSFDLAQFMTSGLSINATDTSGVAIDQTPGANYGSIVLPKGGTIRFDMVPSDLDVEVTYRLATRHEATLEVYNNNPAAPNFDLNTAQLIYDRYDQYNAPSKAYSSVVYNKYDSTVDSAVTMGDHRAIKGNDKLPWISASQATLSGSLGGDTGRVGKTWNPKDLPTSEDPVIGGNTVMALLAGSSTAAAFRSSVNGLDFATAPLGSTTLVGLRKTLAGELYGDPDVTALGTTGEPSLVDVLWEIKTRIEADTATGGLKDTYLQTVEKGGGDTSVAYTYYDLTAAQVQAYLLELFEAQEIERANNLAYRVAYQRYLTVYDAYSQVKDVPAYSGLAEPQAPARYHDITVGATGKRTYQGEDYTDNYLDDYSTYLDNYEAYLAVVIAASGTGGAGVSAPTGYPGAVAPAVLTIPLLDATAADTKVGAYSWVNTPVPTETPNTTLGGNTIETRSGRTVWVALEADSAYEVASVQVRRRGAATDYNTLAEITVPVNVMPVQVTGYQNIYSFTMPDEDCVVRVNYRLRGTRKLNIAIHGADGQDDNLAIVEAYSVADPAAVTPQFNQITNLGYTGTPLPSGGSYDATNDIYTPDPVEKVFTGSTVTTRIKVADGYVLKSIEAKNADDTSITIASRVADDPKDGMVYTFTVPNRTDELYLVITYAPEDEKKNTATIRGSTEGDEDMRNEATWYVIDNGTPTTPTVIVDVAQGTHLTGHISVAPGYYIKAITAWGPSGNYSFTVDGNGYNNGYGTWLTGTNVPLNLYVDMPAEDLVVDVIFAKGPPEPSPVNTLTLFVKDDDNDEADLTKAAPNWAKAAVYDTEPADLTTATAEQRLPSTGALPGDVVGKNAQKGNGTLSDRKYVEAGKWVKVDFEAYVETKGDGSIDVDKSYYVSGVTAGPSNLGIALRWDGPNSVSFYMPAGSTSVTVEFSKYPANGRLPDYVLTVRETYTDLNDPPGTIPSPADSVSYITLAQSDTIELWSTGGRPLVWRENPEEVPPASLSSLGNATGAATAGEEVTMTFQVDEGDGTSANPGWYYQSVVLISNGAAVRLSGPGSVIQTGVSGTVKTYQVKFNMPSGPAEFVVNYRRGPKPDVPDYAFTLTLDDPDNVLDGGTGQWDENNVVADFHDPTGAAGTHDSLKVGHNEPSMTAVQHIHAGDVVELKTTIAGGYHLDYMIVNPTGLHIIPVWKDANTATFTMPQEGVAVVARVVKGPAKEYTANLILRWDGPGAMPAGVTLDQIGRGTFVLPDGQGGTVGSRNNYPTEAIFSTTQTPGTTIPYDLYAFDGYYIDRVTVDPAILGVTGSLSGSCGEQNGDFVMPAADVNVNVWLRKGWPDEIPYDLTIKVHDSSLAPDVTLTTAANNYAAFRGISGRSPLPTINSVDKTPVYGGQTRVVDDDYYPLDRDTVFVDVKAQPGFYVDSSSISVYDTQGNRVEWWYVPGGIAFTQPPRAVTVEVTFKHGDPKDTHTATLHVIDPKLTDTSTNNTIVNDDVTMAVSATSASPSPTSVNAPGGVISGLRHGDALDLSVLPGAGRHVSAAYAVDAGGNIIPIYGYDSSNDLTSDLAQFIPGKAGTVTPSVQNGEAIKGAFSMPEADVDVYVKFAEGIVDPDDVAVKLIVSGEKPANLGQSGSATAHVDGITNDMDVAAPGMDSRFTTPGTGVLATFKPKLADDYDIVKLEVISNVTGASVPYHWITVIQDPPTGQLPNTNTWSGNAPAPGISHPGWAPNPEKQIELEVPAGGVTIHVTYGKVTKDPFRVQVVVNDPHLAQATPANPSKNNAWVSKKASSDANDKLQKKLQVAKPGEWVDLDITVHPGYRIEFVKVIPQSFGIVPNLPIASTMPDGQIYYLHDQTTGFYMPNGDCTVYVKFVADGVERRNVTLIVDGAPSNVNANYATVTSPSGGTKGPVYVNAASQTVQARPTVDWITSDYYWDTTSSSVAAISVKTTSGVSVPFTQTVDPGTGHGQITFPMTQENVLVTITYRHDPTPVGQQIVLHVIDKDHNIDRPILIDAGKGGDLVNYGQLDYAGDLTINAGAATTGPVGLTSLMTNLGSFETTSTIYVPAGQTVDVTACSDDSALGLDGFGKVYIESAYVLFEQNGQMINFNLQPDSANPPKTGNGFSGLHNKTTDQSSFVVHPGRNDVYVTLTRVQPQETEYAAVLMIRSPSADTSSEAGIHADQTAASWAGAQPALRDKVRANDPNDSHAYVTAVKGDKITISVEPAAGYIVDYIQVTPLGFPLESDPAYDFTVVGNTYTFKMPHCNVAITVYLKQGENQNFNANLHFRHDPNCTVSPQIVDYAKLTWTHSGEPTQSIWADKNPGTPPGATGANAHSWSEDESAKIKEGTLVTLDVTLDSDAGKSDVILSAFAIQNGTIVPLTPTHPADRTPSTGLEGVAENASFTDNAVPDASATFTMPRGDVDVYVVVTTDPPPVPWHTAVLVATDHSPVQNNSGLNKGYLWNYTSDSAGASKLTALSDDVPTIAWLAVPEGEQFAIQPDAAPGYSFVPPATLTCNDGIHNKSMTTPYTSTYLYIEPMDTCNKVVHIDFESEDDLELTVEIEDPDNPGDGIVEQVVEVDPAGNTPPTLRLTSTSVAGSYQIISGVTAGGTVELDVKPYKDDIWSYQAYAQLYTHDGNVTNIPLTDADNDGIWEGSFPMPANNARVVITFYEGYEGRLTLVSHIQGDTTGQATMKENKRGLTPLNVTSLTPTDAFPSIPNGTTLDAQVTSDMTGRTVKGLLTVNGSTTLLPASPSEGAGDPEHYRHTIDRADAEITLVLDSPTEHPNTYIAAVQTVNKPASAAAPTIKDMTTSGQLEGGIWTTAVQNDQVDVTFRVPYGYQAVVTATADNGATVTFQGGTQPLTFQSSAASASDSATLITTSFTMPGANVQVKITYEKVIFDLTLRVVDTSGETGNATAVTATSQVISGGPTLTADGQTMQVKQGASVDVAATPTTTPTPPATEAPHIVGVYYQTSTGATVWLSATQNAGVPYNQASAFTMPAADTTVTVIYDRPHTDGPDDHPYYIATVNVVDPDNRPGNKAIKLWNTKTSGLPASSPNWAAGYPDDGMTVSYQAEQGYYVTITAIRTDTGASIPVLQTGSDTNGTASVTMPKDPSTNLGSNVLITITYSTTPPSASSNVALQLIEHGADAGNKANTTNFTAPTALLGLSANGTTPNHPPHVPTYTAATDPVEEVKPSATVGDDLRTLANWANGYQVVRMTVAVRNTLTLAETPEVELLTSRYGTAATSRAIMPPTGTDEIAVIRVYYGNIYNATFHLVGVDAVDPQHEAIDVEKSSGATLSYTDALDSSNNPITKPIKNHLDRFEGYQGNNTEEIRTSVTPGPDRRVVDVVWESDLTGAASAAPNGTLPASGAGRYDFTMPAADVDFYAFFEEDDPDNKSYVAKVAFAGDSQHLGNSQNAVSIANTTNNQAPKGKYWVGAKGGETIEVTVKVAPGYKAEIITTKIDDQNQLGKLPTPNPAWTDPYHYYISRTQFVPNLTTGKTAAFTMPLDTDATVTVRYIKGYDLELQVTDTSGKADDTQNPKLVNEALVTTAESTPRTLQGTSEKAIGTPITYAPTNPILQGVDGGVNIRTDVTQANSALYKVFRATAFTGTVRIDLGTAANPATSPYTYAMPSEDTVETVLFYNEDTPLLAKVELEGDSDINGNRATPIIDHTDTTSPDGGTTPAANKTTTGTIWTTTADGNTIDLTLTVAKGYIAKIKVRRDDSIDPADPTDSSVWKYLDAVDSVFQRDDASDPSGFVNMTTTPGVDEVQIGYVQGSGVFGANISDPQHFRFVMPSDSNDDTKPVTDVTVIVEFVKAADIPRPFDPRNDETVTPSFLDQGFIYGENRGDFAVIEIPTLAEDTSDTLKTLFDTDNYTKPFNAATKDSDKDVTFEFYLRTVDSGGNETYTRLDLGVDVELEPYDTEDADTYATGDPYNYHEGKGEGMWTGAETWPTAAATDPKHDFVGSKFKLIPTEPVTTGSGATAVTARTAGAQKLYDMLNNKGSLESYADGTSTKYRTQLFVIAKDSIGRESDYTQVWIRPWFGLGIKVISYAPTHTLVGNLYKLMDEHELNVKNGYWDEDGQPTGAAGVTQETPDPETLEHYKWDKKDEPEFTDSIAVEGVASGKWLQILTIRSSELLGPYDSDYDPKEDNTRTLLDNVKPGTDLNYALELRKASNLTYTRIRIDLNPNSTVYTASGADPLSDYYLDGDYKTRTFMLQDTIQLIAGDVDGNGKTKIQDYDAVYDFVYRSKPWTRMTTEPVKPDKAYSATDPDWIKYATDLETWKLSVYNPATMAFRCDLDGNGRLTAADLDLVTTRFNYNRDETHYHWYDASVGAGKGTERLPFGLGPRDTAAYGALFALNVVYEGELLADVYWDSSVDPATTLAVPMETFFIDQDGNFTYGAEKPEKPPELGSHNASADIHGERLEIPVGEEVLDRTGAVTLPVVEEAAQLPEAITQEEPEPISQSDERGEETPGEEQED